MKKCRKYWIGIILMLFLCFSKMNQTTIDAPIVDTELDCFTSECPIGRKEVRLPVHHSEIHGIYLNTSKLTSVQKLDHFLESIKHTEINAVVIDIKTESGKLNFYIKNDLAIRANAVTNTIPDMKQIIDHLHSEDIYVIGRIVTFMDSVLCNYDSAYAVCNTDGSVLCDRAGAKWSNPYSKAVWNYVLDLAEQSVLLGFDEIQFDYVRFSTEASSEKCNFGTTYGKSKEQIITEFIKYASKRLHKMKATVSADVFGAVINSSVDASIVGQNYKEMSKYLDYICPMIYPSHYGNGCYGLHVPDLQPYELILYALSDSKNQLSSIQTGTSYAVVRPWLQDFTAKWKKNHQTYGPLQVREQIEAVYDSGYSEWLLWNSSSNYTTKALRNESVHS